MESMNDTQANKGNTEQSLLDYAFTFIKTDANEAEIKFKEVLQINSRNSKAWRGLFECEKIKVFSNHRATNTFPNTSIGYLADSTSKTIYLEKEFWTATVFLKKRTKQLYNMGEVAQSFLNNAILYSQNEIEKAELEQIKTQFFSIDPNELEQAANHQLFLAGRKFRTRIVFIFIAVVILFLPLHFAAKMVLWLGTLLGYLLWQTSWHKQVKLIALGALVIPCVVSMVLITLATSTASKRAPTRPVSSSSLASSRQVASSSFIPSSQAASVSSESIISASSSQSVNLDTSTPIYGDSYIDVHGYILPGVTLYMEDVIDDDNHDDWIAFATVLDVVYDTDVGGTDTVRGEGKHYDIGVQIKSLEDGFVEWQELSFLTYTIYDAPAVCVRMDDPYLPSEPDARQLQTSNDNQSSTNPNDIKLTNEIKSMIYVHIQNSVNKILTAPATAEYQSLAFGTWRFTVSGNTIDVYTFVDSENTFGAMVRNDIKAKYVYENNDYFLKYLEVGGEIVLNEYYS